MEWFKWFNSSTYRVFVNADVIVRLSKAMTISYSYAEERRGFPISVFVSIEFSYTYFSLKSSDIFICYLYSDLFSFFYFSLKSPAPPLGYLGHSAHIPRSSSVSFIHNMYIYSIQIQDGPVWSGFETAHVITATLRKLPY